MATVSICLFNGKKAEFLHYKGDIAVKIRINKIGLTTLNDANKDFLAWRKGITKRITKKKYKFIKFIFWTSNANYSVCVEKAKIRKYKIEEKVAVGGPIIMKGVSFIGTADHATMWSEWIL